MDKHGLQRGMLSKFRGYAHDRMADELKGGKDGAVVDEAELAPEAAEEKQMEELPEVDGLSEVESAPGPSDAEPSTGGLEDKVHLVDPSLLTPEDIEFLKELLANAEGKEAKEEKEA